MNEKEYEIGQQKTRRQGPPPPGGMAVTEKSKDFTGTFRKLIRHSRRYVPAIVTALVCAVTGTVLTLAGPDKLSEMTDLITAGLTSEIDMDAVVSIGLTLAAFYLAGAALTCAQNMIMARVTQKISQQLRTDISEKINRLPMSYYGKTTTGDVLSRVTNDVDTIGQSLNQSVGNLVSAAAMFLGCLWMMLTTNVIMTVTAVLASLIGFGFMALIMGRSQKYFIEQQNHLGELNGHIEEIYAGHTVVKAYNGERAATETFDRLNRQLEESGLKAQTLSGLMMPFMSFIGNFGYVAVCVAGAMLAMNGQISFGVIVAFMMYVRYFTQPLSQISQAVQSLQSAAAAGERVFEFLEAEEMEDESEKPALRGRKNESGEPAGQKTDSSEKPALQSRKTESVEPAQRKTDDSGKPALQDRKNETIEPAQQKTHDSGTSALPGSAAGGVRFDHVKFGYDPDRIIIHDFSADVKPGQKIAIVGPTGAGKTTIVNLLMRFYELDGGNIFLGSTPIREMRREDVHDQFCMVLQDTWLFEGTIRENLVYNAENIPDSRLDEVCRAVGLYHFIRTLPKGYDTILNDHVALSQGQKQQMTIARAMLSDKPMLILDEATSSVDTRTEQKIQSAMDILMKGRTSFVIAHRLSTIKNADLILVLKDGDVIERGTHEKLLAQNGFYAELYNSQFEQSA